MAVSGNCKHTLKKKIKAIKYHTVSTPSPENFEIKKCVWREIETTILLLIHTVYDMKYQVIRILTILQIEPLLHKNIHYELKQRKRKEQSPRLVHMSALNESVTCAREGSDSLLGLTQNTLHKTDRYAYLSALIFLHQFVDLLYRAL